jgi:acetolactate synthase-1/3 small subunit
MGDSKAIFSVLAANNPGVLLRVSGLFYRRGFNIDSVIACKTENPYFSRLTIVATGDEATFTQLIRQLLKLEDIKKVKVLTVDECSNSELLLVKVRVAGSERGSVLKTVQTYGARVLDIGDSTITIEITGQTEEIDEFIEQLECFHILEMARTGINALQRGDLTIHDDDK